MKIAIVNQPQDAILAGETQRGSVAIVNWELAQRLAARHEVTVYARRGAGEPATESWRGVAIQRLACGAARWHQALQIATGRLAAQPYSSTRLYYRGWFTRVAAALRRAAPDVVHLPVQLQFGPLLRATLPRARLVLHMHQDELAQLGGRQLEHDLAAFDAVVTVSDFVTRRARARFPQLAGRIHTIGNGVDVGRFRPRAVAQDTPPRRLLFVGRIAPDKGVHLLLEAFARLARERADLSLTLVGRAGLMPWALLRLLLRGDPGLAHLRPFYGARSAGWLTREVLGQHSSYPDFLRTLLPPELRARVHWRCDLPLPELARLYAASDLLILPSVWQESYGLPVAEAMASGLPVLASVSGGIPELVVDGVTGVLVPRFDAGALQRALDRLLADPEELRRMGRAARQRALEVLAWEHSAARLEALCASVLQERAGSGAPGPMLDYRAGAVGGRG